MKKLTPFFAIIISASVLAASVLTSCTGTSSGADVIPPPPTPVSDEEEIPISLDNTVKEATEHTVQKNQQMYTLLDFEDERELEFAQRGLIAKPDALEIKDESGMVIWSQEAYSFLGNDAPGTANPSLWRNAQLNHIYGLFEVTEGIYQVRGYDMTNITFIAGDTGWIIFDPLMSVECSQAAMELVNAELGERPVMAVVMSHPHVDHYGGIKGVISEEDDIPIIVPEGFEEHAVSENVYAGNAMARRAGYQYGALLNTNEQGALSIGIGMGQSKGTVSYISPNDIIKETGETRTIDGVLMEFQMTPGTEAPAEMNTWFPDKNALWMAENCTATLHNLYTLRGAQVRDGGLWARYIMESIALYGDDVEVVFQSHNWPHWGNEFVLEYMRNTAAMYEFINSQTLMYINQGYTMDEISYMIKLPAELEKNWYTRQYYGTVAHNAKAVYQRVMGWYDANPANLFKMPLSESAQKYIEYLGDTNEVLRKAKEDYDKGEYQWVAEITNILVFADPSNTDARYLCADALEQLAYTAESGAWRNAYLSGALELRNGVDKNPAFRAKGSNDTAKAMTPDMLFDYWGIMLDYNAIQDMNTTINFILTDDVPYLITINFGVLLYQKNVQKDDAAITVTLSKDQLFDFIYGNIENIDIQGDITIIEQLLQNMEQFEYFFNIIEP